MPTPTLDLTGFLFATVLATIALTPLLSVLVLWRYRRAVERSMHATARGSRQLATKTSSTEGHGDPELHQVGAHAPIVAVPASRAAASSDGTGWLLAQRRMRSICYVYLAAGAAYGLVAAIVALKADELELLPVRLSVIAVVNAWPLVPTVLEILAAGRRTTALVWAGYVLLILLFLSIGADLGLRRALLFILIDILPPAVPLLAVSGRNLRAVGPFLAAPVFIASAGLLVWPWLAWPLVRAGATVVQAGLIIIVAVLVVTPSGLAYLWWSARQYARKRASDQTLLVSQWWFLVTLFESISLLKTGIGWALAYWLAYLAFRIVRAVGLRLRKPAHLGTPSRLLLLRVFGAQRRSELLLRRFGASWRHLGPVQMIAGTDLAAAALEPHEFLDSLRGKLNRQFVADGDDLRQRLVQLDLEPDPDGRYRVNELFCHDDTWRPTVQELVHRSDCILVDLRGFTPARQGATYEITQLVELVPLRQVLILTDDTTDHAFLKLVLDAAWRGIGPASPNWVDGGALRMLQMARRTVADTSAVVALLSAPNA
jgi:hypothetical protein